MSERFGTLRALLQEAPSEAVWRTLLDELRVWGEEERERVALPYVVGHLERWPAEIGRWAVHDYAWAARLTNTLNTSDPALMRSLLADDVWVARCRHLRLDDPACYAPLLEGCERLAQLGSLALSGFGLDEELIVSLLERPWPSSLRRLDLITLGRRPAGASQRIIAAMAANPSLSGLEELRIGYGGLDAACVEALAGCPHMRALRVLHLSGNNLDLASARALAQSPYISGLRWLDLSVNQLDAASGRALAQSANLAQVTRLDVSDNPLGAGLAALMGSPHTRALITLQANGVAINAACARALCAAQWPPNLRGFALHKTRLDRHSLDALADAPGLRLLDHFQWSGRAANQPTRFMASPHLTGLRSLELYNADAAVMAAAMNPALGGLESLTIRAQRLTPELGEALARSPMSASVRSLTIRAWHPGVGALFEAGAWSQLRRLSLFGGARHSPVDGDTTRPSVTDEDVERLARSGVLEQLEALGLDVNLLSDAAAMALADSGMLGQLRELGLMENQIGDVGIAALIERGGMTRLEVLRLSKNLIGDAGAAAIARGPITLAAFRELARAELHWNPIGLAGVQALLRSPLIHEIEELDMSCDTLTHEDILALAADPALANLRGTLSVYVRDDSEETWQALIDSPYASEPTRENATRMLEYRRMRERQGR